MVLYLPAYLVCTYAEEPFSPVPQCESYRSPLLNSQSQQHFCFFKSTAFTEMFAIDEAVELLVLTNSVSLLIWPSHQPWSWNFCRIRSFILHYLWVYYVTIHGGLYFFSSVTTVTVPRVGGRRGNNVATKESQQRLQGKKRLQSVLKTIP